MINKEIRLALGELGVMFLAPEGELRSAVGNQKELEEVAFRYLMPAMAKLLRATYPDGNG